MTTNLDGTGERFRPNSERDAFLAAIIAQPDDDVARLVFADWLQENGQETRAQFVRTQIWAAQAEPFSIDARKHTHAAEKLLEANRGEWSRHLQIRLQAWQFRRGFVEHAAANVATFPRDAEELFRAEPIRSLQLIRFASAATSVLLDPIFEVPQLERITRLNISGRQFSPADLVNMTACRYLGNLTDLCLRETPVDPGWMGTLIAGGSLPALVGLDLAGVTNLGPRLACVFPQANHRRFVRLNLNHIRFHSNELKDLLDSRCVREIEELRLAWLPRASWPGALANINPGWILPWNRLRLLDLDGQQIGDDGVIEMVKAIVRRPSEAPLRWFGLANNHVGSEGVRALLSASESKLKLYHLDLRGNGISHAQIAALHARFPQAEINV